MKRALLASALALAWAQPAAAQWEVHDIVHTALQEKSWLQQARDMAQSIQGDVQRLRRLQMSYDAITRVTDLGSAVNALSVLGIQNPLPVNPHALQALVTGQGGAEGMLGSLSGLYTGTLAANRVYEPAPDTWIGQQIASFGGGIAGAQAVALQLHQSAAERVPLLNELQARIDAAPDPSERESLIARFGAEQAYIQNQQVQAQSLGNYMAAQFALRDQQREERLHFSVAEARAMIAASTGGTGGRAPNAALAAQAGGR